MKFQELISKSKDELTVILADLRSRLFKLNFEMNEGKIKDSSQVKKVKKDIARILTTLNVVK